jgi:fructose-bisphosphate aldolase class II
MIYVYESLNSVEGARYLFAATFGNVHGVYKPGQVQLQPKILRDGQKALKDKYGEDTSFQLVFHGGSGSRKDEIEETLEYGVVKMNIDTDTQYAFTRPMVDWMFRKYDEVLKVDGDVGYKKSYDPRSVLKAAEKGMAERVYEACCDLRSIGTTLNK